MRGYRYVTGRATSAPSARAEITRRSAKLLPIAPNDGKTPNDGKPEGTTTSPDARQLRQTPADAVTTADARPARQVSRPG
ncbi:hypothetical protein GCM10009796_17360 [Microbacterium koreense]